VNQVQGRASLLRLCLLVVLVCGLLWGGQAGTTLASGKSSDMKFSYKQTNLVSDLPGMAAVTDPNLVNPWGITASPTSPFWVSDNGKGVSTLYNGAGQPLPLVVTIPPPMGSTDTAAPTGVVFNGTTDFTVSAASKMGPARFIFATEDGTISGWNPTVDPTHAILAVDNSASGAVYKGLALANDGTRNLLYAANFHAGMIDVFDTHFAPVHLAGSFSDPAIPAGYAPFNIQNLGGKLYVTYAKQDADKKDDVPGQGRGFVDVYNTNGTLQARLIQHGQLNAPWGLAMAPDNFGKFSHALLVGNFGNGRINAYDPASGRYLGHLRDAQGKAMTISGLWGLMFGNGASAGSTHTLFFTAGIDDEAHGLFGAIDLVVGDGDNDGDD